MPGDKTLTESAAYPRDVPVACPRYELDWYASEAVRAASYLEAGIAQWGDLDSWMGQAPEVVGPEKMRLYRERHPPVTANG